MTTLQPIRMSPIGPGNHVGETSIIPNPTTPRATYTHIPPPQPPRMPEQPGTRTPTRDTFAAANGKRSLPESSNEMEDQQEVNRDTMASLKRHDSLVSTDSQSLQDVDMADSDEGEDASDNESGDEQSERPSKKKKKGQRFFCTDYPPCSLSFTRSEHLARHIRKHTGERPFQCHCARRFSRLDNLRQHAQTVHVNEEIPGDSLAATGTRFQRQIRTDRVRPPGARSRASTGGSTGSHHRGHARNLSTSSIGSTTSTTSTISTMSDFVRDGVRPHSLNLSDRPSPRGGLTIDTLRASPQNSFTYQHQSPSGASTPTSYVYSNTPSSPYGSTLGSPVSLSRNPGSWNDRAMGRRLSVPSGSNPFQAAPGSVQGPPYLNPLAPSNSSQPSSNNSTLASPTSSNYSFNRNDPAAEAEWRRRTWHPTTYSSYNSQRPATSGLSYSQTPDAPRPAFAPQALAAAGHTPRLPGIETFDKPPQRPPTPPRQVNPLQNESPNRPLLHSSSSDRNVPSSVERRGHSSWDMSLHQNLTRLEIASGTPPREPAQWIQQTIPEHPTTAPSAVQNPAEEPQQPGSSSKPPFRRSLQKSRSDFSELDEFPQPPQAAPPHQASQVSQSPPAAQIPQFPQPPRAPYATDAPQAPQAPQDLQVSDVPPPIPQRARRQGWYNPAMAASQPAAPVQRPLPRGPGNSESLRTAADSAMGIQAPAAPNRNNVEAQSSATSTTANVRDLDSDFLITTDSEQKPSKAPVQNIYSAFPAPPQSSQTGQSNIYSAFPAPPSSMPRPSQPMQKPDTSGLDVLVAAATSESRNQLEVGR